MAIHSLKVEVQGAPNRVVAYVDDYKIGEKTIPSDKYGKKITLEIGKLNWGTEPKKHFKIYYYKNSELWQKVEFTAPYIESIEVRYFDTTWKTYSIVSVIDCSGLGIDSKGRPSKPIEVKKFTFYVGITVGNIDIRPIKMEIEKFTTATVLRFWPWKGNKWGSKSYIWFDDARTNKIRIVLNVGRAYTTRGYVWSNSIYVYLVGERRYMSTVYWWMEGYGGNEPNLAKLRPYNIKGKKFYIATWAGFDESANKMVGRFDIKSKTI